MIHFIYRRVMIAVGFLILLAGCGQTTGNEKNIVQSPAYPVTCIAVLPAVPAVDVEGKTTPEQEKTLQQGARVMNRLLAQELGELEKVTLVSEEQMSSLELSGGERSIDVARLAGRSANCNAVLETSISRYSERIGSKWSVEQAAAVAFEMRLIGTDAGSVLWTAKFNEEQVPVLENLYHLSKAKTRGFTWITADELMLEGIREKISNSPYFQELPPEETDTPRDDFEGKV